MTSASSRDLVKASCAVDREAFASLVRPHLAVALGVARLVAGSGEDGRDALQEALLAAWQDLPKLRDPLAFPAWFPDVGPYSVEVGTAVLANGLLSEASLSLPDDRPRDMLIRPDGVRLVIESLDGGGPFVNAYEHGWREGTERVRVRLTFEAEWFEPGAELVVVGITVR